MTDNPHRARMFGSYDHLSASAAAAAFLDRAAANPMFHHHYALPPHVRYGVPLSHAPAVAVDHHHPHAAPLIAPSAGGGSAAFPQGDSKKKGATFHQQPTIPPANLLGCRDFYAYKGNDKRRIAAMMMGVSTSTMHGIELNIDEEPFAAFKREVRPTNLILQEELLRRAVLGKARVLPRPSQWEKEKIIAQMTEHHPLELTEDDVAFLAFEIKNLRDYYWAKKEENNNNTVTRVRSGWGSLRSHLRFYHVLLQKKKDLTAGESTLDELFWQEATIMMNDADWVPCSIPMPNIHPQLAERQSLDFLFDQPVETTALKLQFDEARTRLCTSSVHQTPHLMYLMSLVQRKELDPILLLSPKESSSSVSPGGSPPLLPTAAAVSTTTRPTVVQLDHEPVPRTDRVVHVVAANNNNRAIPLVPAAARSSTPLLVPPPPAPSVPDNECSFLQASLLHVKQVHLYNTMESEWLRLEEKLLEAADGSKVKELNTKFLERKKANLKQLKKRMRETAALTRRYSKRLRLNDDSGA